nr:sugar ABC transporter substrate-binding protein [Ktedonobacteraceae bacterium]
PDVFWLNAANLIKFASNDTLLPLDDQISKDKVDLNNYPPQLVSLYTYNGKHYGMPKDFDTIGLWYNKALFDAAGVKYPDNTWTWDTVKQAAQKLTNPARGVWGIAAPLNDHLGFYNTIPQSGGYVISPDKKKSGFDQSAGITGLQYIYGLIQSKVSPSAQQMTDTPPVSMFESGKVAMMYAGSWQTLELAHNEYTKDKVDVAVLPQGKQRATVIHGLGNVISAGTKNAQAAWEFDKFLGSKDAADIQARTGTVIPAYNGTQSAWAKSLPQYHLQAYIDELPYAVPYPISKNTDAWVNAQDKVLGQVWTGSLTVEDGAKQLGQQINQMLAKE